MKLRASSNGVSISFWILVNLFPSVAASSRILFSILKQTPVKTACVSCKDTAKITCLIAFEKSCLFNTTVLNSSVEFSSIVFGNSSAESPIKSNSVFPLLIFVFWVSISVYKVTSLEDNFETISDIFLALKVIFPSLTTSAEVL